MRRVGAKGAGEFERITWDEALAEIKSRWTSIIAEYGSQAIMPHAYLGHQGVLNGLTSGDAFFNRLGSTVAEKTYCESGSSTAWHMTVGGSGGLDVESMAYSKYIIVWGMNMTSTNLHGWPFLLEARRNNGAKIVVIDPVLNRTARQADWHIPIRPGTDGALAMGMIHEIIAQGLVDTDYVERYTVGYDELAARAANYPPERVEEITGIPADDVRKLAANTPPASRRPSGKASHWNVVVVADRRSAPSPVCPHSSGRGVMWAAAPWRCRSGSSPPSSTRSANRSGFRRAPAWSTSSTSAWRSPARWSSTRRSSRCSSTTPTRCHKAQRRKRRCVA